MIACDRCSIGIRRERTRIHLATRFRMHRLASTCKTQVGRDPLRDSFLRRLLVSNQSVIEVLESRTLMSAAPVLFDKVVKADRAVVQAELAKFNADIGYCAAKLTADSKALAKAGVSAVPGAPALIATLKSDITMERTALKEDRLTQAANALAQESIIDLDIRQILKDKGNSSAEITDHAKLVTDRATLQGILITGLNTRIATRTTDESTITTAANAVVAAVQADTSASAALTAAATKFGADEAACLTKLATDLMNITNARTTLMNDLTAEASM
jgi:hypothetical protein